VVWDDYFGFIVFYNLGLVKWSCTREHKLDSSIYHTIKVVRRELENIVKCGSEKLILKCNTDSIGLIS